MDNLDNLEEIKKLDKKNYLGSVEEFLLQAEQAWEDVKKIRLPREYKNVNKVVFNAMGGSALGGRVIKSLFADRLKVPFEVINSYTVPAYVDQDTLFVFSSYSGTTEEVLETVEEACRRKAKCLGITTGGELGQVLSIKKIPFYLIDPKHNPSGQPRAGVGYSIMGVLGLMRQIGLIEIADPKIKEMISKIVALSRRFYPEIPESQNIAKKIALAFKEKAVVLVGAEFIAGSLHVFGNQLHETAKNYANYFLISELNHHLMEGLSFPKNNPENLFFLFIASGLFHPRIQKRFEVTKDVIGQNKIPFLDYRLSSADKLSQAFEVIVLGSFVSFYLALLNGVDPSFIPWVDYFKNKLTD